VLAIVLLFVLGCAGDGILGTATVIDAPPGEVTLESIQTNIFTPRCAIAGGCHAGADAPHGQDLSEGRTYASIVDVASAEVPEFLRVEPGDPDNSYLLMKVSGDPRIAGERMPFGGPYLELAEIDSIRQWIEAGAPDN
jgi:hypothetical protein